MRRIAAGIAWIVLALLLAAAGFLAEAHWEIRSVTPAVPTGDELVEALAGADGPVSLRYINTAMQRSRSGSDGLGHPAFLLEWSDGRSFLIDVGMDREGALAFGKLVEVLFDAAPIEFRGSVAEQLGDGAAQLGGIAFTHLHVDHTGGLPALCAALGRDLPLFQTPWQAERGNYTTASGAAAVEAAGCARPRRLAGGPIYAIPGFPGLVAVAGGGHTPGSTIFFARVADTIWGFAGDVSNVQAALLANQPKERFYSLLITPEAPRRLEELRLWLAGLDADPRFRVVVSHDVDAVAAAGVEAFRPERM